MSNEKYEQLFKSKFQDNFWVMLIMAWPWAKHLPVIGEKGYKDPIQNISKVFKFIE